eukprot:jgi/Psemu1/28839/gm1.28839_g
MGTELRRMVNNGRRLRLEDEHFRNEQTQKELRGDRDIVMTAIKLDPLASEFASEDLRKDRDIARTAITLTKTLVVLSRQEKNIKGIFIAKAIVLAAIRKNDRQVVLAAVQNYGEAYLHASLRLQYDKSRYFPDGHGAGSIGLAICVPRILRDTFTTERTEEPFRETEEGIQRNPAARSYSYRPSEENRALRKQLVQAAGTIQKQQAEIKRLLEANELLNFQRST